MAGKRTKKLSPREKRKKDIRLIVQSNELVEARYMFDTWEMRFFYFFASMIRKNDEEDKKYRVWLKDIKQAYKLNNNDSYHQLREASTRLSDKSVFLNYEKDGTTREIKHRFIKFVDYAQEGQDIDYNQEYIDVSIDKEMLPFLLHVQKNFDPAITRYTSYDFRNIIGLKPYSMRIYQLLKKEEYRKEILIVIDDLKKMFNIVDEYKRFSTLYQRIIEPSLISINDHTDITVPMERIEKLKRGRKIYAIRIPIYSKTKKEVSEIRGEVMQGQGNLFEFEEVEIVEEKTRTDILYEEFEETVVKDFGVTPLIFIKMLSTGKYKKEAIEQAIEVTRRAKYNQEIKKSVPAFFVTALKNGFTDEKIEKKKKQKEHKKEDLKGQKIKDLESRYAEKRADKVKEILETVEGVREQTLEYLKVNKNQMLKKRIEVLGLSMETTTLQHFRDDKILRGFFVNGITHEYKAYFESLEKEYQEELAVLKKGI